MRGNKTQWELYTVTESGCWLWYGASVPHCHGYATVVSDGKRVRVHRRNWVEKYGPIPKGLVLDHLCRNRSCVNPDHLEVVTVAENVWRGESPRLRKNEISEMKKVLRFVRQKDIVKTWRLSQQYVSGVATGHRWAGVL